MVRPNGNIGLIKRILIRTGSTDFAAAWTSFTQGPLAAPATAKQLLMLVPQKQGVASPAFVHVVALAEMQA